MVDISDWLNRQNTPNDNPGLNSRYWMIHFGQLRGPSDKTDPEAACKDAFGCVSPRMLLVDCGTRIAPLRTERRVAIAQAADLLYQKGYAGIFQADWNSLSLRKIADWRDEPYISIFKTRLDREMAMMDPRKRAFEIRIEPVASKPDGEEHAKKIWREMFESDPDVDPRFVQYLNDLGYEVVK